MVSNGLKKNRDRSLVSWKRSFKHLKRAVSVLWVWRNPNWKMLWRQLETRSLSSWWKTIFSKGSYCWEVSFHINSLHSLSLQSSVLKACLLGLWQCKQHRRRERSSAVLLFEVSDDLAEEQKDKPGRGERRQETWQGLCCIIHYYLAKATGRPNRQHGDREKNKGRCYQSKVLSESSLMNWLKSRHVFSCVCVCVCVLVFEWRVIGCGFKGAKQRPNQCF